MDRQNFQVGDKVLCNGYGGAIATVCSGKLEGMYEVRLMSGLTCVSGSELTPIIPVKWKSYCQPELAPIPQIRGWRIFFTDWYVTSARDQVRLVGYYREKVREAMRSTP